MISERGFASCQGSCCESQRWIAGRLKLEPAERLPSGEERNLRNVEVGREISDAALVTCGSSGSLSGRKTSTRRQSRR